MKFINIILNFFWIFIETVPYIKLTEFTKQKWLQTKHLLLFLYINWYINQDLNLTLKGVKYWKLEYSNKTKKQSLLFMIPFLEDILIKMKPDLYFYKDSIILYPLDYLIEYYKLEKTLFLSNLKNNWLIKYKDNQPQFEITSTWLNWWLELKTIKEEQNIEYFAIINIKTFNFFLNKYDKNSIYKLKCQQPIKKGYGYLTEDGHYVRSKAELVIDNWLYSNNISHSYEKTLPIPEFYYCDFYIKEIDVYIEYWGSEEENYIKNKQIKLSKYKEHNLKLIEITNKEERELDSFLKNKLIYFW